MAAILQHYMVESVHNDLYNISELVKEVFSQLTKSDISTDGYFSMLMRDSMQKSLDTCA